MVRKWRLKDCCSRVNWTVLAIFDKPDPLEGPYFEETYYVTPSRHSAAPASSRSWRTVKAACAGMGLREGPVHAEVRLAESGCVIIEVASRTIGGECARLLTFGTGHSLEDAGHCTCCRETVDHQSRLRVRPGY